MTTLDQAEFTNRMNFLKLLEYQTESKLSEYKKSLDLYNKRREEALNFYLNRTEKKLPLNNQLTLN